MVAADGPDTTPPPPEPIATCENVTKRYERRRTVTALEDVSLAVTPGEFLGLEGPSGSGKSTLLHLLAALDVPTAGTVTLQGRDPAAMSARERARLRLETVGMIFQRFHLLPSLSARANVTLPLVERGVSRGERNERGAALLERVGLGDRQDHRPGELSGGEQQRVAIARALALDPPLVVADEPTGELDTETGARILDLLDDVATGDRAVVMASHDPDALTRTDRVVELRDGRVLDG